ncbi:Protein kinase domain [Trypanosoma melophagium]|uniref:Protein kinase domain n=1 Tax=Trypanosoma melophagium TaxID=715481 RepID=UPI00351A6249|nr:Protein kinase domain [Trypanosoma melophagium]
MSRKRYRCDGYFIILIILLCLSTHAFGAAVRLWGSVYNGLTEEIIREGGSTFQIQAVTPIFKGFSESYLRNLFFGILSESHMLDINGTRQDVPKEKNLWFQQLPQLADNGQIEVLDNGRSARFTFKPYPQFVVKDMIIVVPCLPISIIQYSLGPSEVKSSSNCIIGPTFLLTVKPVIQLPKMEEKQNNSSHYITGDIVEIPFTENNSFFLSSRVKIMEGYSCLYTRGAVTSENNWDADKGLLHFVPHRGGIVTICYLPFPEMLPYLMLKVGKSLHITGPEGISTEPPQIRSGMEFTGTVYGTNLTDRDVLVITEELCDEFAWENVIFPEFSLSSSTRTIFSGTIEREGIYHVCYRHEGSSRFVKVSTLLVELANNAVIMTESKNVYLRGTTDFAYPATIDRLQVKHLGRLALKRDSLNVSSFLWSGGNIVGQGEINSMGSSTITSNNYEPRTISFLLRNYGDMIIDVHELSLEADGVIHNYGNLTITVLSLGGEGVSSIRSRSRNNVIVNQGGIIRIIVLDKLQTLLCQTRIVNKEGTLILSGKVNITELSSGEKSRLVFRDKAIVRILDARLKGSIVMKKNSELTILEDCVFLSATVEGNESNITIVGESVVFDSLRFLGNVTIDIIGQELDNKNVISTLYGLNYFGKETNLNLRRTHFIPSTGSTQLVSNGAVTVEFDTVHFSGNTFIRIDHFAVMYGRSGAYFPDSRDRDSRVRLTVSPNATLVVMDTGRPAGGDVDCGTLVAFLDALELDGRLLLHGCLALPHGGVVSGTIEPLRVGDGRAAGILVGGALQLRDGARLALDAVILRNAAVRGAGVVRLAAQRVEIDRGSRLTLHDGVTLNTNVTCVNGGLDASVRGVEVRGLVDVRPGAALRLFAVQKPSITANLCATNLRTSGGVWWTQDSQVECHEKSLEDAEREEGFAADAGASSEEVMLVSSTSPQRRGKMESMQHLFPILAFNLHCSDEELHIFAQRHFLIEQVYGNAPYEPPPNIPTVRVMIVAIIVIIFFGILSISLSLRWIGMTWKEWLIDFKKVSPLRLTLYRGEFTSQIANYVVLASVLFNTMQLPLASFHPRMPVPVGFMAGLSLRSMHLIMPHHHFRSGVQLRFVSYCMVFWGIFVLTFFLISHHDKSIRLYQMKTYPLLHAFSKINYTVHLLSLVFTVPIISMILDIIACNTILYELPTCEASHGSLIVPCAALFVMIFLLPLNKISEVKLLRCDLSVRFSVLLVVHVGMLVEIAMWKVFYQHPFLLLLSNLFFQGCKILVYSYSTPTAYVNVNRLLLVLTSVMFMVTLSVLPYEFCLYFGLYSTCRGGETYFITIFFLAFMTIITAIWIYVISPRIDNNSSNDPSIDAINRSVEQIRNRIEELKYELLACPCVADREDVLNASVRLRAELMEKQEKYRYEKYRCLLNFYYPVSVPLSSSPKSANGVKQSPRHSDSDKDMLVSTLALYSSSSTLNDSKEDDVESVTQEDLESFRCGPALGSGSYGTVHLGILSSGKLVAVKYVSVQNSCNEALSQAKVEVDMLKKYCHPNIIRYYGSHTAHGYMMIFMEFAVAGSLTSIAKKFSGLNESVICLYIYQVLLGLRYLHSKGVVHRDIKGENILVNGFGVVKLADFGSSKVLAGIANRSHAGCETLVGSPFWMAPEVIRNEPYGTKADIWSVGCTVVEMLNGGLPPWRERFENVYSVMFYVGSTDNIPDIPEDTSEACRDFLNLCFQRDTTKRPSSDELLKHPWLSDIDETVKLHSHSHSSYSSK